jgi:hypothetical protein
MASESYFTQYAHSNYRKTLENTDGTQIGRQVMFSNIARYLQKSSNPPSLIVGRSGVALSMQNDPHDGHYSTGVIPCDTRWILKGCPNPVHPRAETKTRPANGRGSMNWIRPSSWHAHINQQPTCARPQDCGGGPTFETSDRKNWAANGASILFGNKSKCSPLIAAPERDYTLVREMKHEYAVRSKAHNADFKRQGQEIAAYHAAHQIRWTNAETLRTLTAAHWAPVRERDMAWRAKWASLTSTHRRRCLATGPCDRTTQDESHRRRGCSTWRRIRTSCGRPITHGTDVDGPVLSRRAGGVCTDGDVDA